MVPELTPLDPIDEATVDAVHALQVAADADEVPDFPPPCPYVFRGNLTHPVSTRRIERSVARAGGEVVGYLVLVLSLRENLANVDVTLQVHPACRRRGVGRALYTHLVERTRALGRTRLTATTVETLPGGPARNPAGSAFAATVGAKTVLEDVRRRLDLTTLDERALPTLHAQARARATGYQLVSWRDSVPEEYAADVSYLDGRLISDSPSGDMQLEPWQMDVTRLRELEALTTAQRIRVYATGAVHEQTGRLVALTEVAVRESSPWHALQWITLVDPPHRGHRLGALVKVENLQHARAHEPALRLVDTWNAAANRHMISINEAMGFRPVDRWINWQQEV